MNWTPSSNLPGLEGAEKVFITQTHVLAFWNTPECHGWELYAITDNGDRPYRWITGVGKESFNWTVQQAQQWAILQIFQVVS